LCRAEIAVKEIPMRVMFFAQLKDVTGCDSVELAPALPLNVELLWAELLKQFPKLAAHRASVRLARNWEYAAPDAQFFNSDEVALIPPVSGG
jgi:molybdopterin synthase sulfur carrier subunit